jgi:hypothetical protein
LKLTVVDFVKIMAFGLAEGVKVEDGAVLNYSHVGVHIPSLILIYNLKPSAHSSIELRTPTQLIALEIIG